MGTVGGAASGSAVVGTGGHPAAVQQRHAQKVGATVGTMLQLGTKVPVGLQLSDALEPVGNELEPSMHDPHLRTSTSTRSCTRSWQAAASAPAHGPARTVAAPLRHTDWCRCGRQSAGAADDRVQEQRTRTSVRQTAGGGHRWRPRRFCKQSNTHAAAHHAVFLDPRAHAICALRHAFSEPNSCSRKTPTREGRKSCNQLLENCKNYLHDSRPSC